MISVRGISKSYRAGSPNPFKKGPEQRALDDASFEVGGGEAVALVGRNGAGKTTLLKILCTLVLPDAGAASVCGHDVVREPAAARRCIGYASGDERSFYWRLTGRQNLALFAALQDTPPRQIRERVGALLGLTGLEKKADMPFKNYSSGMRQRLSLARSLIHGPEVLLLDEPNRGLDPLLQQRFMDFLRDELLGKRKMTILLATHNLREAAATARKVALLDRGKLLFFGPPDNEEHLRGLMEQAAGEDNMFDVD